MLEDRFGRPLTSVRISITQRCNLNCLYCHREGIHENSKDKMTPDEIETLAVLFAKQGVKKVKITGGEPLLRKDVCEIVEKVSGVEGIKEVSMTTNGTYLPRHAAELSNAGLKRVNISIDTFDPEKYRWLTGGGEVSTVVEGIKAAGEAGLSPVKLNMVVMQDINLDEIEPMAHFASQNDSILQLIGLMENEFSDDFVKKHFYDLKPLEKELEKKAKEVRIRRGMQNRKKYMLNNGTEVEVVSPMHNTNFCARCTRMRITADGRLKPCLMREDNLVDILMPMRNGASDDELGELIMEAMENREPYFKEES